jgi:hypothetical protein
MDLPLNRSQTVAEIINSDLTKFLSYLREDIRKELPYKLPKSYISWEELSSIASISLDKRWSQRFLESKDYASLFAAHSMALWTAQRAPLFCIAPDFLKALQHTKVLDDDSFRLKGVIDINLPTFLVAVPKGSIKSPYGHDIDYFVVHISQNHKKSLSEAAWKNIKVDFIPSENDVNIHWTAIDTNETVWFSGWGYHEDSQTIDFTEGPNNSQGLDTVTSEDSQFLKEMRELVLSILFTLSFEPSLITEGGKGGKTKTGKRKRNSVIYPRWLGKEYRLNRSTEVSYSSQGSPKRTHWRSGHWRKQRYGEKNLQVKMIRIEPVLVNG